MKDSPRRKPAAAGKEASPRGAGATALSKLEDDLQLARQKSEAAARNHWEFLVTMAHEMRNPMTAIMGMTDLTLLTELSDEQREYLSTVKQSAQTLMRTLDDVLDYARIGEGTLDLEFSGFRFRQCVQDALRRLAPEAHGKGLELVCRVGPEVPDLLVADPRRVAQVIERVVGNAIKFTKEGEVSFNVQLESQSEKEVSLRFTVSDTGVGISADDQKRIFAPFAAIQDSAARSYGGAGLPIAAALVGMMGGHIKVQSTPGQGSCFEFTLRMLKQQAMTESKPFSLSPLEQQIVGGKRLLIVEGNERARRWLSETVARWGMQVETAKDAQTALAQLPAQTAAAPEVALLDASLPGADSLALAEELDRRSPSRITKILLLSSRDTPPGASQCRAAGIAASLVKPVFEEELRDAVVLALGRQAASSEASETSAAAAETPPKTAPEDTAADDTAADDTASEPCCDPQAAMARLGGDEQLYGEVVGRFLEESQETLDRLGAAIGAANADQVHRIAHGLKGLAAMCGCMAVALAAAELEQQGRQQQLDKAPAGLAKLQRVMQRTRQELAPYARSLSARAGRARPLHRAAAEKCLFRRVPPPRPCLRWCQTSSAGAPGWQRRRRAYRSGSSARTRL